MKTKHIILLSLILANISYGEIAILKWATHPALDEVEASFVQNLGPKLRNGTPLVVRKRNANARLETAQSISESISRPGTTVIVAFGTPAAQAVVNIDSNIPVFFAAVSDPDGAGITRPRVAGIRNVGLPIIRQAIQKILQQFPGTTEIGTIYNPGEQNSVYVQSLIKQVCEEESIKLLQRRMTDKDRALAIAERLYRNVDIIFSANDNSVNIMAKTISSVARERKKIFVIGETSAIDKGPFMAVGVDYVATGEQLAELVLSYLNGEKSIRDIGIKPGSGIVTLYNTETASEIGVKIEKNE